MAKVFKTVPDGEEVFPVLYKPWAIGCCDCGLVHDMEIRLYHKGKRIKTPNKAGYRVSIVPIRNNEATKQLRDIRKYPCVPTKRTK